MTTKGLASSIIGAALFSLALPALADPLIYDIGIEVRDSTYVTSGAESTEALIAEFSSGALVCSQSIAAVDNVGSSQTCGGPSSNIATLITVVLDLQNLDWRFGADWGNGGVIYGTDNNGTLYTQGHYSGDYWWNFNWNDPDVIGFETAGSYPDFTLGLLGFEGCCAGGMSLQYSSDNGASWSNAAVNAVRVPEASTLMLFGLGLLGLGASRRLQATAR